MTCWTRSKAFVTVPLLSTGTLAHQEDIVPYLTAMAGDADIPVPVLALRTADALTSIPVEPIRAQTSFALLVPLPATVAEDAG